MIFVPKSKSGYAFFKIKERLNIKQQDIVLLLVEHRAFFGLCPVYICVSSFIKVDTSHM